MGKFDTSVADQLWECANNAGGGHYCQAPRALLLHAASLLGGETDHQMYDRIYGPVPIDGTGWAEAAFVDDVDPASRELVRAIVACNCGKTHSLEDWYRCPGANAPRPFGHYGIHFDSPFRGQGE